MATKITTLGLTGTPRKAQTFTGRTAATIQIDGSISYVLENQYDSVMLVSDNSSENWWVL